MKIQINHIYILAGLALSLCFLEIINAQQEKKNFSNIDYSIPSKNEIPDNRKVYISKNSENDLQKKLNSASDSSSNAVNNQEDTFLSAKCITKVVL